MKTKFNLFFYSVLVDCLMMVIVLLVSINKVMYLIRSDNMNTDMYVQTVLLIIIIICASCSGVCDIIYCYYYLKREEKKKLRTKIGFCFCVQAVLLAASICVLGF